MMGEGALVPEARCHPDHRSYMQRAHEVKVTRLTPGDLHACYVLASPQGGAMGMQKSAEAEKSQCTATKGRTCVVNWCGVFDA